MYALVLVVLVPSQSKPWRQHELFRLHDMYLQRDDGRNESWERGARMQEARTTAGLPGRPVLPMHVHPLFTYMHLDYDTPLSHTRTHKPCGVLHVSRQLSYQVY